MNKIAIEIQESIRLAYLRRGCRLFWACLYMGMANKPAFGSKAEVLKAMDLLVDFKILNRVLEVRGPCGETYWEGVQNDLDLEDPDQVLPFLYKVLCQDKDKGWESLTATEIEALSLRVDVNVQASSSQDEVEEPAPCLLTDVTATVAHWRTHPDFGALLDGYKAHQELICRHVDRGAESWEVALFLRDEIPEEQTSALIRMMMTDGHLTLDKEASRIYVTAWYPKTIARVVQANKDYEAKALYRRTQDENGSGNDPNQKG